jgi:hypothetical protein
MTEQASKVLSRWNREVVTHNIPSLCHEATIQADVEFHAQVAAGRLPLLRTKKIATPATTAAATIIQGHQGMPTVAGPHMFVSVAVAVAVMPGEVEDNSTITPVSLSQ